MWFGNNSETVKWINAYQNNPLDGEIVLCVDIYGNMAICKYDAYLKEYHLSLNGITHNAAEVYGTAIHEAIAAVGKKIKRESFLLDVHEALEEEVSANFSEAYFDYVEYWMPKPPMPIPIAMLDDKKADEITFMTNFVLDDLERIIKASINNYLIKNTSTGNEDATP